MRTGSVFPADKEREMQRHLSHLPRPLGGSGACYQSLIPEVTRKAYALCSAESQETAVLMGQIQPSHCREQHWVSSRCVSRVLSWSTNTQHSLRSVCAQSCPTLQPHGSHVTCQAPLSMEFSRRESGVGCHSLLQGIFLTQGLNPGSPALQADSLPSEPPGKAPYSTNYVILRNLTFSGMNSLKNWTRVVFSKPSYHKEWRKKGISGWGKAADYWSRVVTACVITDSTRHQDDCTFNTGVAGDWAVTYSLTFSHSLEGMIRQQQVRHTLCIPYVINVEK